MHLVAIPEIRGELGRRQVGLGHEAGLRVDFREPPAQVLEDAVRIGRAGYQVIAEERRGIDPEPIDPELRARR